MASLKILTTFCLCLIAGRLISQETKARPNVIIILADDMGFSDLGCYGSEVPTPNIDMLARNGLRLKQFYNGARCCPSRASLLTGLYPHQAGVGLMTEAIDNNPSYQGYLNKQSVTIAEAMQQAGYFTMMAGKWHLGHKEGMRPADRGFIRSLNAPAGGFYFSEDPHVKLFLDGKPVRPEDGLPSQWYSTDLWTDYSLKFIDEARAINKPYMLYLAENAPHFPLQAREEDIARFRGKYLRGWKVLRQERYERQLKMGLIDPAYKLPPMNPLIPDWESLSDSAKKRYDDMMAIYAANIVSLDRAVGRLIDGLKERRVFENTVIIFLSDNGGNAEPGVEGIYRGEHPGHVNSVVNIGQCWAEVCNTPFWLYKHHTSEGGIAAPFIISWPAGLEPSLKGKFSNQVAHIIDLMPTLLALGGGNYPTVYKGNQIQPMEGASMVPLFKGHLIHRKAPIFWEHEGNRAMRDGKWKIVSNVNEPWQLYDMEKDRTELHDLSGTNRGQLNKMVASYEVWYKRVGAQPYFKEPKKWQYSITKALNEASTQK